MALIINKQLETQDGYALAAGLFLKFSTTFTPDGDKVIFTPQVWMSQAAFDEGKPPLMFPPAVFRGGFSKNLTEQDYENLAPATVHQFFKDILEALPEIGEGFVEIV